MSVKFNQISSKGDILWALDEHGQLWQYLSYTVPASKPDGHTSTAWTWNKVDPPEYSPDDAALLLERLKGRTKDISILQKQNERMRKAIVLMIDEVGITKEQRLVLEAAMQAGE